MTPTPLPLDIPISELAALVDGSPIDPAGEFSSLRISGFASLLDARPGDLAFFNNDRYLEELTSTGASAVLVRPGFTHQIPGLLPIEVASPSASFARVVEKYAPRPRPFRPGVHRSAVIEDGVQLDPEKVSIGPKAVIEENSVIGDGTRIGPGSVVGQDVTIGEDCEIGPGVFILYGSQLGDRVILHPGVVLGADGFGFEFVDGRHQKIEQLGIVRLENDVEVGASTTIDRARFGETVIGEGTKIDNQVQIAHNVVTGKHCIIVAQTGISGSTQLGDYVTLAARTGVAGHLTIGTGAITGARSGVIADIKPGEKVFGYPAKPWKESMRSSMYVKRLGGLYKRVKELEEGAAKESSPEE